MCSVALDSRDSIELEELREFIGVELNNRVESLIKACLPVLSVLLTHLAREIKLDVRACVSPRNLVVRECSVPHLLSGNEERSFDPKRYNIMFCG